MADATILIVEDENIIALDLRARLSGLGYRVVGMVPSGEEALLQVEQQRPAIVLMDIVIKGKLDGVQTAQLIRERFHIPVIYLTAYSDETTLARARVTEPYGYILKPFEDRELHTAIEIALYKHAAEQQIKESEQRFRLLADTAPVMIWMTNTENQCTYLNKGWLEFRGRTMEQELNQGWLEGVHPDDRARLTWLLSEVMPERAEFRTEYRLRRMDGIYRWLMETGIPRFVDGAFAGYIGSCFDITERKEAEEQLRYLSTHDQLTGLSNRTFFEEWANRLEHSRLYPISAIMIDMDGLKVVNDVHGHAMGDAMLQRVAAALAKCFRAEDILARIGGDEFAVWLPETDEATAMQMIARVQTFLAAENATLRKMMLSVSMGAATATQPGSLAETLKLADARMYQAKHAAKFDARRGIANESA